MQNLRLYPVLVTILLVFQACKKDCPDTSLAAKGIVNASTYDWVGDTNIGFAMNEKGEWAVVFPEVKVLMGGFDGLKLVPGVNLQANIPAPNQTLYAWNDYAFSKNRQLIGGFSMTGHLYATENNIALSFETALGTHYFHFLNDTVWFIREGGGQLSLAFKKFGSYFSSKSFNSAVSAGYCNFHALTIDENKTFWMVDSLEKLLYRLPYGADPDILTPVNSPLYGYRSLQPLFTTPDRITLQVDDQQRLWIMSGGKICRFDIATETFTYDFQTPHYDPSQHSFSTLYWDKVNKRMWLLGDENSISYFKDDQFSSLAVSDMVGSTEFLNQRYHGMGVKPDGTCMFWGKNQAIVYKP